MANKNFPKAASKEKKPQSASQCQPAKPQAAQAQQKPKQSGGCGCN